MILDDAAHDALKKVGGYVRKNKVVIARVSEGNFVAVTQICSHQGAESITFRSTNSDFYCTKHGAIFRERPTDLLLVHSTVAKG